MNMPKRSECTCECHHTNSEITHCAPCCVPDVRKVVITKGCLTGREAEVIEDSPQDAMVLIHPDGSPPQMTVSYPYDDVTFLT